MPACVRQSRWHALLASFFIEFSGGTPYGFGVYSDQLKAFLAGSQSNVNLVSSIGNIGMYVGILGGFFYDRYGAVLTSYIGGALMAGGYILAYLATADMVPGSTTAMSMYFLLAWQGSGWCDGAAVSTNIKNFPDNPGSVVGLLKSFFGLSGSILAQLSIGFFSSSTSQSGRIPLLCFLAVLTIALVTLTSHMLVLDPVRSGAFSGLEKKGQRRILFGYTLVSLLSLFLCTVGVLKAYTSISHDVMVAMTIVMILMILLLLLIVTPLFGSAPQDERSIDLGDATLMHANETHVLAPQFQRFYDNFNCAQVFSTPEFYLLFLGFFTGTGTGLMVLNNITQIVQARVGAFTDSTEIHCFSEKHYQTLGNTFVTICGVSNSFGRLSMGYASDAFKDRLSRCSFLVATLALMAVSQILMRFANVALLYVACVLCFVAYGSLWALVPAICAELFGEKHLGSLYQLVQVAPACGSLAMSACIASVVYKANTQPEPEVCVQTADWLSTDYKCFGPDCYGTTFEITFLLCIIGAVSTLVLSRRTSAWYTLRLRVHRHGNDSFSVPTTQTEISNKF